MPSARTLALAHAAGRVGIGGAMLLRPAWAGGLWVGRASRSREARLLTAGLGVRDAALGAAILTALQRGDDVRPLVAGGLASDFVDLVATVRARREIPPSAVAGVGLLAIGSTAVAAWILAELSRGE